MSPVLTESDVAVLLSQKTGSGSTLYLYPLVRDVDVLLTDETDGCENLGKLLEAGVKPSFTSLQAIFQNSDDIEFVFDNETNLVRGTHKNILAAGSSTASSGNVNYGETITIPTFNFDKNGHITSVGRSTITLPSGYELPKASSADLGGIIIGEALTVDEHGVTTVVEASDSVSGIVRLNSLTNSDSTTEAATPKAVSDALSAALSYIDDEISKINIDGVTPNYDDLSKMFVTNEDMKFVIDETARTFAFTHRNTVEAGEVVGTQGEVGAGDSIKIPAFSIDNKGHITSHKLVSVTIPKAYTLPTASTTEKGGIVIGDGLEVDPLTGATTVREASTTQAGQVKLNSSTTGTSETEAATPKAVSDALSAAKDFTNNAVENVKKDLNDTGVTAKFSSISAMVNSSSDITAEKDEENEVIKFTHKNSIPAGAISTGGATIYNGGTILIPALEYDSNGHIVAVNQENVTITPFVGINGIEIENSNIGHSNNITAGSVTPGEGGNLNFGDQFKIPTITYDENGHITGVDLVNFSLPSNPNVTYTVTQNGDTVTLTGSDGSTSTIQASVYTHPTSGVTAGTYKSVTVDKNGHVTGGTNPTTLAGYGITDAEPKGTASTAVSTHNTASDSHSDIRELITGLTTRLNTLADSDDTTLDQMSEVVDYIKANKELIDSITTSKVSVSDIVDNLTTNVTNKPLAASQGVAIKALIDALQTAVNSKAASADLTSHTGNTTVHITSTERTNWNAAKTHADSAHAPSGAQVNVIETIKVNGTALTPSSKAVNITVPTNTNQLTNGAGFITSSGTAKTISDTLPVSKGGTGNTTAVDAANMFINSLSTGDSVPEDADYFVSQYASGGTAHTTFHRRPVSALWSYMNGKISTVLGLTSTSYGGNAASATKVNGHTVNADVPSGAKFTDTVYTHPAYTAKTSGLYKITVDATGHVSAVTAVTKNDITALGIPSTNTTYSAVTTTANGLATSAMLTKLNGIAEGADAVSFTQALTSGTKVGTININGTDTILYAPSDTHYTTHLYAGASGGNANATTATSNPYLLITDNTTNRNSIQLKAGSNMAISAVNGVVTFTATNTVYTHPSYTTRSSGLYKITVDATGHVSAATAVTKADITALGIPASDTNTTYTAGTGLTLSGTQFKHSNSVTAGTAKGDDTKTLTFGGTFKIPTVTYDAQGHITGVGTTTMTMPANPNVDTKVTNTLATTTKAYVTGTTSASTSTGTQVFDTGVYLGATAGQFNSKSYKIAEAVTLEYDSTKESLDFVFA